MSWTSYVDPRPWKSVPAWFGQGVGYGTKGANAFREKSSGAASKTSVKDRLAEGTPWTNQTGKKWYELLDTQRAQALGEAPSLAEAQYRQAQGDTQAALRSAAAGTNRPGMMRASLQQQANVGQGMATGVTQARLQERMAQQAAYAEALKGAGMMEGRDQSTWVQLAQILNGKPAEPSTWDRVAAMAPLLAML